MMRMGLLQTMRVVCAPKKSAGNCNTQALGMLGIASVFFKLLRQKFLDTLPGLLREPCRETCIARFFSSLVMNAEKALDQFKLSLVLAAFFTHDEGPT